MGVKLEWRKQCYASKLGTVAQLAFNPTRTTEAGFYHGWQLEPVAKYLKSIKHSSILLQSTNELCGAQQAEDELQRQFSYPEHQHQLSE
jgi:hypothetical protein